MKPLFLSIQAEYDLISSSYPFLKERPSESFQTASLCIQTLM